MTFRCRFAVALSIATVVLLAASARAQRPVSVRIMGATTNHGEPLTDVHLSLLDASGKIVAETDSDPHGAFRFGLFLRPGTYRVRASHARFADVLSAPMEVRLASGLKITLKFELATPTPAPTPGPHITPGSNIDPLIQPAPGTRIAVLRFDATGLDPTLGDGVAEMVAGQISNNPNITIVERSAIDRIVKELEIQRSGLTTADAVQIGRGLNVQKVLLGSVRRFGADTYLIQSRLVDVGTQQIQGSREVTCEQCKESDLLQAVQMLRPMIVR
jgi:TolB-like protein